MSNNKKNKISNPPVILLNLPPKQGLFQAIYQKVMEYGYGILDFKITNRIIPDGTNVVGLLTNRLANDPLVCNLRKDGCQVVRIGTYPSEEDKQVQAILPNISEAGKLAANHFADRQFKNVAYIENLPIEKPRHLYNAFHEQALKRKCNCYLLQVKSLTTKKATKKERFEYRMNQVLKWLETCPKPIGVFCDNDIQAAGIYTTAKLGGFAVPEDVALLGYGNDRNICDFLPVPLSSIDMNFPQQGRNAFNILHQLILGKTVPSDPIMISPKRIIVRQSTNLLAVEDPIVATALRYIWDHYATQLSIDDIAATMGVSRTMLTRKFRQCLGHGVNAELRRKRIERACKSLRSESYTIAKVAETSGFPSVAYFHIAFRNTLGMTPGNYRKGINNKD